MFRVCGSTKGGECMGNYFVNLGTGKWVVPRGVEGLWDLGC